MKVTVHGIETQYQQMGQGFPLVLLHGWGCDWQIWHTLIAPLSQNYQLIIPDLPAFGTSAAPEKAWTSLEYVNWLKAFLEKVVADQTYVLVGHSFGGKIAALFSVRYAEKVKKLILIASSGLPANLTPLQQLKQTAVELVPSFVKDSLPTALRLRILKRLKVSTDNMLSSQPQRRILQKIIHENIAEQLSLITVPTLLLWGTQDPETPLTQGQNFHRLIKHSQFNTLDKAGHFVFLDDPQWVIAYITNFIA